MILTPQAGLSILFLSCHKFCYRKYRPVFFIRLVDLFNHLFGHPSSRFIFHNEANSSFIYA